MEEKPVIELPDGTKLGKTDFIRHFEEKVFYTIRHFNLLDKKEKVCIALSGGKDSLTLLSLMHRISLQNPNIALVAITINEGIHGYRDKTVITAKKFCEKFDIPLHVYSYEEEFGMPLDDILKVLDIKPCSICGVFRRYLLNKKAKELGCTKLATGHNMDDECQSVMMNQFKNNMQASARLGPMVGLKRHAGFIQRIKPLYLCSEKEVALYAFLQGILDDFIECPNVSKSYRAQVRDMLNNFESQFPGTKQALIHSLLDVLPSLKEKFKDEEVGLCKECGEPASKDKCKACVFVDMLKKAKEESAIS